MNKIIAISGKAESGKTTFATILEAQYKLEGKRVIHINFADEVKFIAEKYYGWNGIKDEKGRSLLQSIGTEFGRNININIWVRRVAENLKIMQNDFDIALISDARFPNEIDFGFWKEYELDFTSVRVKRPEHKSKLTEEQLSHPSETALDKSFFDFIVSNDSNLEDFVKKGKKLVEMLTNGQNDGII